MKLFKDPVAPKSQLMLLPPSVDDFVDDNDPVRIVDEIIDSMDHSELISQYSGGGAPAYDPITMLKVIIFGYCEGIRSSRKLDAALSQDLRFMYLAQMSRPDFRTIARFRRMNNAAIRKAFEETVRLGFEMNLVLLKHVSLDGTKIEANVSGKHTYKKERLDAALENVGNWVSDILDQAQKVDEQEDNLYGDCRGDELPKRLSSALRRKKILERAKRHLEQTGSNTVCATDLESRVMKTRCGNRPAYNCQAVVDKENQIIVAAGVVQDETDHHQMPAMMQQVQELTGRKPDCVTMDAGYFSNETLRYGNDNSLNIYVPDNDAQRGKIGFEWDQTNDEYICPCGHRLVYAITRQKCDRIYRIYRHSCASCSMRSSCCGSKSRVKELWRRVNGELEEEMAQKMSTDEAKSIYKLRKQIIEPVFGNLKENNKMRRLLLRGLKGAEIEYLLSCVAHNIGKIGRMWTLNRALLAS